MKTTEEKNSTNQAVKVTKSKEKVETRSSIKRKLIVSYIICAIVPLVLINLYSSKQSKITVEETSSELAIELVKQNSNSISFYTDTVEKVMTRIIVNDLNASTNNLMSEYARLASMNDENAANLERHSHQKKINTQLSYSVQLDASIDEIALVMEDGKIFDTATTFNEELVNEILGQEMNNDVTWYTKVEEQTVSIYAIKDVVNINSGKKVGKLIIKVNYMGLQELMDSVKLFDGAKISLLNQNGEVICSNIPEEKSETLKQYIGQQEKPASEIVNNTLVTHAVTSNGWSVIAEIPEKALTHRINSVVNVIWILIAIIAVIAVGIAVYLSSKIVKSVQHLKGLMKKASQGDLTVLANIQGKDEMAELGNSFNHMLENIQKLLKEAKSTTKSSLQISSTLDKSTQNSIEGFTQLGFSMDSIAEGSNKQAEDIKNGVEVMEKLSGSIQDVIEDTSQLIENNQGTKVLIQDANTNMEILNTVVHTTHEVSEKISNNITELTVLTKAINEIMKLLDGISEQTNLLALNASIEAARAGELGKGFAVVADEVRNLATQSKESSNHVKEALKKIEDKIVQTSSFVVESNNMFQQQEKAVKQTFSSLGKLIEGVQVTNQSLGHINEKVQLMSQCKNEMAYKIENIACVSEENAAVVEEVNALTEEQIATVEKFRQLSKELMSTINGLQRNVETFRVNEL